MSWTAADLAYAIRVYLSDLMTELNKKQKKQEVVDNLETTLAKENF